jgi:hypothetical protein
MRDVTRTGAAAESFPRVRATPGDRSFAVKLDGLSVMSGDEVASGYLCGGCGAALPIGGLVCEGCGAGVGFDDEDGIDWAELLGGPRPAPSRPAPPAPLAPPVPSAVRALPRFAPLVVSTREPALAPRLRRS